MFLAILSRFGVRINKWLICTQEIRFDEIKTISIDNKFVVRQMTYEDFVNSGKFDKQKLVSLNSRFNKTTYVAYGVFNANDLAYYCWLSLKDFQFSKDMYDMKLDSSEGLLFDAFCFPKYRGNGLHNFMNIYRLKKLSEFNRKHAVVILLSQNVPARKSQKKAGFTCSKAVTTYSVFGKKGFITTQKKIDL